MTELHITAGTPSLLLSLLDGLNGPVGAAEKGASSMKLQDGDIVRVKETGFLGILERLAKVDRYGGGPWLVVGNSATQQPPDGLRECEFIYRPSGEGSGA